MADRAWQAFQKEPFELGSVNALPLGVSSVLEKARVSGRVRQRPAHRSLGPLAGSVRSLMTVPRLRLGFAASP